MEYTIGEVQFISLQLGLYVVLILIYMEYTIGDDCKN